MKIIAYRSVLAANSVLILIAISGIGVASADGDPLIGKTYSKALAKISEWKMDPVVSSAFGSELATEDCIVTSWRKSSYAEGDNFDHPKTVLVNLNCNEMLAGPGSPGNSLASPEGRAEKTVEARAERFNSKPERCSDNLDGCKKFCDAHTGMCSDEVMALLR